MKKVVKKQKESVMTSIRNAEFRHHRLVASGANHIEINDSLRCIELMQCAYRKQKRAVYCEKTTTSNMHPIFQEMLKPFFFTN